MTTAVRAHTEVSALRTNLPFGPWTFQENASYDEFLGAEVQIAATTSAQIIGGVSPAITAITTIKSLLVSADQDLRVGLHGVAAQASGFTLSANQVLKIGGCSISALALYNTAATIAKVFLAIGGS